MFMIAMGINVRDTITGFAGKVTGRVEYITGCNQYLLAPKVGENGDFKEGHFFDEQRLEIVPDDPAITELDNSKARGFGEPAPKK